jgi:hypothetical protein
MRWAGSAAVAALSFSLLALIASPALAEDGGGLGKHDDPSESGAPTPTTQVLPSGRSFDMRAYLAERERALYVGSHADPALALFEYRWAKPCGVDAAGTDPGPDFAGGTCPRTAPEQPPSCEGQDPVEPLWRRHRTTPDAEWEPWVMLSDWACPSDLLPPVTQADFRRLPLAAPALTMQPARGWVLVNIDTIAYSSSRAQTLRTTLLGRAVTVVATPSEFTWDYGDGTRFTTTSPGHPYPDQDVAHVYRKVAASARITLTVTWTGTYQYAGQPAPVPIVGTATTTARTAPFTVEERRAHLVAGDCHQYPDAPGC